jgi:hypothetical protein
MPAFAFFSSGLIAVGYFASARQALIAGAAMMALQAGGAYLAVARSAGPGSERSFIEHYESALVFPIRTLLAQARKAGYLARSDVVLANQPDDTVRSVPGVNVNFGPLGKLICSCNAEHPNVMALFVRYTNLSASFSDHPPTDEEYGPPLDRDAIWRRNRSERPLCLAQMRASCAHVIEHKEGGEITGAIGTR